MADTRLAQAQALAAAGQFRDAMGVLKGILQDDPQNAEARGLLTEVQDSMMLDLQISETLAKAEALAAQGQGEQAQKVLRDVLKVSPGQLKAKAMLESLTRPPEVRERQPNPDAALGMGAFELEALPGELPGGAQGASPSPLGSDQAFTLDSLEELDSPFAESAVQSTVLTGPSPGLAPAETARVQQYLREGQDLFDAGQFQDAIDVWTRIFILDENSREADALIEKAKTAMNANQGEIEHNLTEAIAAFNAGEYDRSRPLLERVLQSFPGHREAQYYLGRINDRAAVAPLSPPPPTAAVQPPTFSAPPPIFSAARVETPAAPPAPAAPTTPVASGPAFSAGSPDEFEFEENLNLPTGEALRSSSTASPVGGFEFDAPAAGAMPPASGLPATPVPFAWDEPPATPLPGAGAGPPEAFSEHLDQGAPWPAQADAPAPGALKVKSAPKGGGGIPWLLIGAGGAVLLLVGVGILVATKFFMGAGGPAPATLTPSRMPKPVPPKVAPLPSTTPVTPPQELIPQAMSPEALLLAARQAESQRDFAKAVSLYQELVSRGGGLNSEAASGMAAARAALQKQQVENERNEKFIKDYQYALKAYREGDFAECLRVSWRLIYPDDTLAKQLGKRDGVARLIRDGYYNWAVMDLKSENVRGADKNLRDLMDFDKSDPEARKLQQFIRPYMEGGLDSNYRDVVKGLTYRPFVETP
jgi:tetratricopeptide (TPR) repeat protein